MDTINTMELSSPLTKTMTWQEIRYSQVWEDQDLLRNALAIEPTDHIVSIGSAGCNALACLLDAPAKVSVVDLSPSQHALLDLRFKAIEHLSFSEYSELFNEYPTDAALGLLQRLGPVLVSTTVEYFQESPTLLSQGILSQGRLEKYFKYFREQALWKLWDHDFRARLLRLESLDQQIDELNKFGRLDDLKSAANNFFGRQGLEQARDREQMRFVTETSTGEYLFKKFIHTLFSQRISANPYLYNFITGELPPNPSRLATDRAENFLILKKNIHKVDLYQSDLESLLAKFPDQSVDKINLSDIFEYLTPEHCDGLFKLISQKLAPNGRLAFWSLFVDRFPPDSLKLTRVTPQALDRLWLYKDFQVYSKL